MSSQVTSHRFAAWRMDEAKTQPQAAAERAGENKAESGAERSFPKDRESRNEGRSEGRGRGRGAGDNPPRRSNIPEEVDVPELDLYGVRRYTRLAMIAIKHKVHRKMKERREAGERTERGDRSSAYNPRREQRDGEERERPREPKDDKSDSKAEKEGEPRPRADRTERAAAVWSSRDRGSFGTETQHEAPEVTPPPAQATPKTAPADKPMSSVKEGTNTVPAQAAAEEDISGNAWGRGRGGRGAGGTETPARGRGTTRGWGLPAAAVNAVPAAVAEPKPTSAPSLVTSVKTSATVPSTPLPTKAVPTATAPATAKQVVKTAVVAKATPAAPAWRKGTNTLADLGLSKTTPTSTELPTLPSSSGTHKEHAKVVDNLKENHKMNEGSGPSKHTSPAEVAPPKPKDIAKSEKGEDQVTSSAPKHSKEPVVDLVHESSPIADKWFYKAESSGDTAASGPSTLAEIFSFVDMCLLDPATLNVKPSVGNIDPVAPVEQKLKTKLLGTMNDENISVTSGWISWSTLAAISNKSQPVRLFQLVKLYEELLNDKTVDLPQPPVADVAKFPEVPPNNTSDAANSSSQPSVTPPSGVVLIGSIKNIKQEDLDNANYLSSPASNETPTPAPENTPPAAESPVNAEPKAADPSEKKKVERPIEKKSESKTVTPSTKQSAVSAMPTTPPTKSSDNDKPVAPAAPKPTKGWALPAAVSTPILTPADKASHIPKPLQPVSAPAVDFDKVLQETEEQQKQAKREAEARAQREREEAEAKKQRLIRERLEAEEQRKAKLLQKEQKKKEALEKAKKEAEERRQAKLAEKDRQRRLAREEREAKKRKAAFEAEAERKQREAIAAAARAAAESNMTDPAVLSAIAATAAAAGQSAPPPYMPRNGTDLLKNTERKPDKRADEAPVKPKKYERKPTQAERKAAKAAKLAAEKAAGVQKDAPSSNTGKSPPVEATPTEAGDKQSLPAQNDEQPATEQRRLEKIAEQKAKRREKRKEREKAAKIAKRESKDSKEQTDTTASPVTPGPAQSSPPPPPGPPPPPVVCGGDGYTHYQDPVSKKDHPQRKDRKFDGPPADRPEANTEQLDGARASGAGRGGRGSRADRGGRGRGGGGAGDNAAPPKKDRPPRPPKASKKAKDTDVPTAVGA